MAKYTYKLATELRQTLCGWTRELTGKYAIVRPDGSLADWPLCDTEEDARIDCRAFNSLSKDDEWTNEARCQARMAGDLES